MPNSLRFTLDAKVIQLRYWSLSRQYATFHWGLTPHSAACERLFSAAGLIFRPKRARIGSKNFENQLLLRLNRRFWWLYRVCHCTLSVLHKLTNYWRTLSHTRTEMLLWHQWCWKFNSLSPVLLPSFLKGLWTSIPPSHTLSFFLSHTHSFFLSLTHTHTHTHTLFLTPHRLIRTSQSIYLLHRHSSSLQSVAPKIMSW